MDNLIEKNLFDGDLIRLGPIDHEKDPEIESHWTHDASFMRLMYLEPMRPLSVFQIKKRYEELEKEADEHHSTFPFRIRAKEDNRLIGLAEIHWISWSNGSAFLRLGIGAQADRGKGYGNDTLRMLLHYAFAEISLFRLSALVPEYNDAARALAEAFGFVPEVQRREALHRDGRRWDLVHYGLLGEEWRNRNPVLGIVAASK
jgi:RimJ/RimL family protein N-acetyltransferase